MKTVGTLALLAAVTILGCVKIEVPREVNVNLDGEGDSAGASGDSTGIPAGGNGSWRDILTGAAGQIFLGAEKGVLFYAFDTLAYPKAPVDLAVNLQTTRDMKAAAGVTIGFYDGGKQIGQALTDNSGLARLQWTPPAEGDYRFAARIIRLPKGADETMLEVSPAPLLVAARAKDTKLAVIDLDHTVVDSSFFRVLVGGARPMADSVEITQRIAKVYGLVYLTHRPDLLTRRSKSWLTDQGYPAGPLLVSELKQAFGDSGTFKTAKLRNLREAFPNVKIGVGDKLSDAQAYVDNALTAYLIPHYKDKPKDMRKMAKEIRGLRGRDRMHVVDGWKEIEAGIFRGRRFPPEAFVRRLETRAGQIEDEQQRERRRKKNDDDDDDD